MRVELWIAIITGVFTLLGTIVTVAVGNNKTQYRIEQLEKKQEKHNTLIERMYEAEKQIAVNEEQIDVINHRLTDLEHSE